MDIYSSTTTKTVNSQKFELLLLDIDDFNALISILKRREENIIQLLDYNLKYRNSPKEEDIRHLRTLHSQLVELEKSRKSKEDQIIQKYINMKISDPKQKR
jgi:hypothetical protein